MFRKLSPQKVIDDRGVIVQVQDRHSVQYISDKLTARVEVEFAASVQVFTETLELVSRGSLDSEPPDTDDILESISQGLQAMGSKVVLG